MIVMQVRTYGDGTTWLRWLEPIEESPLPSGSTTRVTASENCAACHPRDPEWADAPTAAQLPKVDLIYDCEACGRTTFQGRLADLLL
jgi:hypothetical protein